MQQLRGLLGNRARDARVGVAQRRDPDARQQVVVLAAVRVEQLRALAANQVDRVAAIRLQNVFGFASLNFVER